MGASQSQSEPSTGAAHDERLAQWILPPNEARQLPTFTPSTLASSSSPSRLLTSIAGVVYDLTAFADEHPGGREVLDQFAGCDASDAFLEAMHPYEEVWEQMQDMRVGVLKAERGGTAAEEGGAAQVESKVSVDDRRRFRVLYGTQTGTAKSQAQRGGRSEW